MAKETPLEAALRQNMGTGAVQGTPEYVAALNAFNALVASADAEMTAGATPERVEELRQSIITKRRELAEIAASS